MKNSQRSNHFDTGTEWSKQCWKKIWFSLLYVLDCHIWCNFSIQLAIACNHRLYMHTFITKPTDRKMEAMKQTNNSANLSISLSLLGTGTRYTSNIYYINQGPCTIIWGQSALNNGNTFSYTKKNMSFKQRRFSKFWILVNTCIIHGHVNREHFNVQYYLKIFDHYPFTLIKITYKPFTKRARGHWTLFWRNGTLNLTTD